MFFWKLSLKNFWLQEVPPEAHMMPSDEKRSLNWFHFLVLFLQETNWEQVKVNPLLLSCGSTKSRSQKHALFLRCVVSLCCARCFSKFKLTEIGAWKLPDTLLCLYDSSESVDCSPKKNFFPTLCKYLFEAFGIYERTQAKFRVDTLSRGTKLNFVVSRKDEQLWKNKFFAWCLGFKKCNYDMKQTWIV